MGELDPYDRLNQACRDSHKYPDPSTILKKTHPKQALQAYCEYLDKNEDQLFEDAHRAQLLFWELPPGERRFLATTIRDKKSLEGHLRRGQKDPRCRHAFLESDHSRAPLNCTRRMLLFLLVYHQVDPAFLDHVFAFGDQDEPVDACLSHFHYHDTLTLSMRQPLVVPLGRSGREIRHCFLLRAVERAPEAKWPWSMRQMAVYHSFDILNGRTLWITIKGNDMMQKRIMEDTTDLPVLRASVDADVVALFEMSLATLLSYFRWCEENWRWFIRDMDESIRPILVKAKTAPVDREPHFQNTPRRTDTMRGAHPPVAKLPPYVGVTSMSTGMSEKPSGAGPRTRNRHWHAIPDFLRAASWNSRKSATKEEDGTGNMLTLEMFNYQDLQTINIAGQRLEEGRLTVHLCIATLRDVEERFGNLANSDWDGVDTDDTGTGKQVNNRKKGFTAATNQFLPKLRATIRSLEIREAQLVSMKKQLEEGKALFENLLQLRNLQVSRIYAEHGRKSAIFMKNIAIKTEQETFSMRVITVLTMVFLPATFITSFFQSGILEWRASDKIVGGWVFRGDAFRLFVAICVPLTAVTFLTWWMASWLRGKDNRARLLEGVDVPRGGEGRRGVGLSGLPR